MHTRLFQIPVDYGHLKVTQVIDGYKLHGGDRLEGRCYFSGRLYILYSVRKAEICRYKLAVYCVMDEDHLVMLDTLDLGEEAWELVPCVDHSIGCVYIPGGRSGIWVIKYIAGKLVRVLRLKCVENAVSVAVLSTDRLYVCDLKTQTVCQVDVKQDSVTGTLQAPPGIGPIPPRKIAILGDTALVGYKHDKHVGKSERYILSLVSYLRSVPRPGKLVSCSREQVPTPACLTTDHHSSFLLTGSDTVHVLDSGGNLIHTIRIPGDRLPWNCTVVGGELWVGCANGDIVVMSPQ